MEKLKDFKGLEVCEQIKYLGKIFNVKIKKEELNEFNSCSLYDLITDKPIINTKIKTMIDNVRNVAQIFEYTKLKTKAHITNPNMAISFIRTEIKNKIESFITLFLDAGNNLLDYDVITSNLASQTAVYPKYIAKQCLLKNARAVILAHNHPAQTCKPSKKDIILTEKIENVLEMIDITVLDHIIVTDNNYYSFKDNCLMKNKE